MQILPDQVAAEVRVDDSHPLVAELKKLGAIGPKVMLVFDSNAGAPDEETNRWKVRVFYNAPTELETVDLTVSHLPAFTKIKATGDEMIKTHYPDGYVGWCGSINGVPVWVT